MKLRFNIKSKLPMKIHSHGELKLNIVVLKRLHKPYWDTRIVMWNILHLKQKKNVNNLCISRPRNNLWSHSNPLNT